MSIEKKSRAFLSGLAVLVSATLGGHATAAVQDFADKVVIADAAGSAAPADFVIQPAVPGPVGALSHQSHSSHSSHSSHDSHASHDSHSSHASHHSSAG